MKKIGILMPVTHDAYLCGNHYARMMYNPIVLQVLGL